MNKITDEALQVIAEEITIDGLDFRGATVEFIDTGEEFDITVSRNSARMNNNIRFEQFNRRYMVGQLEPTHENLTHAAHMMLEEVKEVFQELYGYVDIQINLVNPRDDINLHNIAKEMTDTRIITGERMTAFGFDVDAIDAEVHRSNMTKTVPYHLIGEALEAAQERYPNVRMVRNDDDECVLQCGKTGKIVKPVGLYDEAVITDEMIGGNNHE